MKLSRLKQIIQECLLESIGEVSSQITHSNKNQTKINEMYYFPDLNLKYYKSENLNIPELSKKYVLYYRRDDDNGFYMIGNADNADVFDHYSYRIRNGVDTHRQSATDRGVYTNPKLEERDERIIDDWSKKPEVKQRREFEKKNFPMKDWGKPSYY